MSVTIKFLGAAGTVTGSKYLIEGAGKKILVDAGLFQGKREWRERNWNDPECDLSSIDAVLLTHAHIDHTGILPRYAALGLSCPVYATSATCDLAGVLLPDSGALQEEEAKWRSKKGKSRHSPPRPLYTRRDAEDCLSLFSPCSFSKELEILPGVHATWERMGHILGAGSIQLSIGGKKITFSGDIGRYNIPILCDPVPVEFGDLLLIESTYGDRLHEERNTSNRLATIVNESHDRGGVLLIPSFAVGRTQLVLFYLRELKEQKRIPDIPIIVDSPMAKDATAIYKQHPEDYDEESLGILSKGKHPFSPEKLHFIRDSQESRKLNSIVEPMIIISASGMLSGGRVLHHVKHRISSPMNTILFVGYQPPGGRGDWIKSGAKSLRVLGDEVPIRAHIEELSGLSAHGDRDEMLRWCEESRGTPGRVAIVHGEPDSARSFGSTLESALGWDTFVAEYLQKVEV